MLKAIREQTHLSMPKVDLSLAKFIGGLELVWMAMPALESHDGYLSHLAQQHVQSFVLVTIVLGFIVCASNN